MVDKSAFGFDQTDVDRWDARQTGQALQPILAKVGRLNRTDGNSDQIREAIMDDPDAISGLAHLSELMRAKTR
jgi:hypothetical protein